MTDDEIRAQVHAAAERLIDELGPLAASDLLLSWSQDVTDRVTLRPSGAWSGAWSDDPESKLRAIEWLPHIGRRVA